MPTNNADWIRPFSEPIRVKRPLPIGAVQFLAYSYSKPIVPFSYYQRLHDPIRVKAALSAASQQPSAFVKAAPFPERVSIDKWLLSLSTPPNRRPAITPAQQPQPVFVQIIPPPMATWFRPFEGPTLGPRRRAFSDPSAFVAFIGSGEIITLDKWYAILAEPTRRSIAQQALQPVSTIGDPAPSLATWAFEWISLSRLVASRVSLTAQQGSVMPIAPIIPPVTGVYTVSGLYVIDQFTDNTVVYDYSGGVSHRTN